MSDQEKRAFLASGDLVSITEAAKLTQYSAEYLSLLARKGRLPAIKIARNWLTTRQAVLAYIKEQQEKHTQIAGFLQTVERRLA